MRGSNTFWILCMAVFAWLWPMSPTRAGSPELPSDLAGHAQEVAERLESNGLAGDRILLKATEGVAKGVPHARIIAALDTIERNTFLAAETIDAARLPRIDAASRRQVVSAMADAMQAGASRGNLEQLLQSVRGHPQPAAALAAGAVAFADLIVGGYDEARVKDLVILALERGFGAPDFTNLVGALEGMRAELPAATALELIFASVGADERPVPIDGLWGGAAGAGSEIDIRLPAPAASKRPPTGVPPDRPGRP